MFKGIFNSEISKIGESFFHTKAEIKVKVYNIEEVSRIYDES